MCRPAREDCFAQGVTLALEYLRVLEETAVSIAPGLREVRRSVSVAAISRNKCYSRRLRRLRRTEVHLGSSVRPGSLRLGRHRPDLVQDPLGCAQRSPVTYLRLVASANYAESFPASGQMAVCQAEASRIEFITM